MTRVKKSEKISSNLVKKTSEKNEKLITGKGKKEAASLKVPFQANPQLYVRFKESIESSGKTYEDLLALHPEIKNIRLPRRGTKERFFFAVFDSKEKMLAAKKDFIKRGDCYVSLATPKDKREAKTDKERLRKQTLKELWM